MSKSISQFKEQLLSKTLLSFWYKNPTRIDENLYIFDKDEFNISIIKSTEKWGYISHITENIGEIVKYHVYAPNRNTDEISIEIVWKDKKIYYKIRFSCIFLCQFDSIIIEKYYPYLSKFLKRDINISFINIDKISVSDKCKNQTIISDLELGQYNKSEFDKDMERTFMYEKKCKNIDDLQEFLAEYKKHFDAYVDLLKRNNLQLNLSYEDIENISEKDKVEFERLDSKYSYVDITKDCIDDTIEESVNPSSGGVCNSLILNIDLALDKVIDILKKENAYRVYEKGSYDFDQKVYIIKTENKYILYYYCDDDMSCAGNYRFYYIYSADTLESLFDKIAEYNEWIVVYILSKYRNIKIDKYLPESIIRLLAFFDKK